MVVPINLITVSIISRTLGPELYGDYRYLVYFFTLFASFIGFGGNFFTTELAKNHLDKRLISFYLNYLILNWLGAGLIMIFIRYTKVASIFFPTEIQLKYLWVAFFLSFLTFASQFLESMTDSCGLTKNASIFNFFAKILGVGVLCLLIYLLKWTNLLSIFLFNISIVLLTITGFSFVLKTNKIPVFSFKISLQDFKKKFTSFFSYSHPLLVLSLFSFAIGFLGRWILQFFGGSVQQGYFSFSDSFSAFIIIFSNSITPLLQREFSISFNNRDIEKMKNLFLKSLLIFTAVTSFLSFFIMINADKITLLIGGKSFQDAIISTQIMILYPIPYIVNNILYATIYATGKTTILRNVQMVIGVLGVFITYFLLAPAKYYGFHMGAIGFALSMVSVTYLNHVLLLKYCTSIFDLKWIKVLFNYSKIILIFIVTGIAGKLLFGILIHGTIIYLLVSGIIYTTVTGFIFFKSPGLIGFTISEFNTIVNKFEGVYRKFRK